MGWKSLSHEEDLTVTSKPPQGRRGLVRRLARIVDRKPAARPVRASANTKTAHLADGRRSKNCIKLIDTRVAALRVEDRGDFVFRDKELLGFGVRVYPSGRKVYIVQTRAPGQEGKRVKVADYGVIPPWEARRRAALIISRIKSGQEPHIPRPTVVPASQPVANPVPDENRLDPEAPEAPVPWETLREAAVRISDDIAGDVIKGWKERKG